MIQENLSENLKFPFDLAHIRRIQYKDTISEFPRLQRDLSQTLDSVLLEVAQASMVVHENKGAIPSARREEKRGHLYLRKNVGKREEVQGLEITISNVEFWDHKTEVFLKIENESDRGVYLLDSNCYAKQNKTQAKIQSRSGIKLDIPKGVEENGSLIFDPIEPTKGNIDFYFEFIDIAIKVQLELD